MGNLFSVTEETSNGIATWRRTAGLYLTGVLHCRRLGLNPMVFCTGMEGMLSSGFHKIISLSLLSRKEDFFEIKVLHLITEFTYIGRGVESASLQF
jgi:hypothetical protein